MPDNNKLRIVEPITCHGGPEVIQDYESFIAGIERRGIVYSGEGIFNTGDVEAERSEECVS